MEFGFMVEDSLIEIRGGQHIVDINANTTHYDKEAVSEFYGKLFG
jgi:hypothetical protein